MRVILTAPVPELGERDDVCDVSAGYARNFLFPRKLANLATPADLTAWEGRRAERAKREADGRNAARTLADKLGALTLTLRAKAGPTGQLYGSIGRREVLEAFTAAGVTTDGIDVTLDEPLKHVGERTVSVQLPWGVRATVTVRIEPEEEEAA